MKTLPANQSYREQALRRTLAELAGTPFRRDDLRIENEADTLDQVISSAGRELAVQRLEGNVRLLRDIRAALDRLKDGTYGTCLECDQPIPARRLDVVPWARLCLKCQSKEESRGTEGPFLLSEAA